MDRMTTEIAAYAAGFAVERLAPAHLHAAKQRLVDTIACALGGITSGGAVAARRIAEGAVPARQAGRIVGAAGRTTAEAAAFINTTAIRVLDFNDTVNGGHPSDTLGAVLALGEAAGADGLRLLGGLAVGYELAGRLIASARLRESNVDQGFAIGVASAAAAGYVLRLTDAEIANAVAIATVSDLPLRATRMGQLSQWKGSATALSARNAVFAAQLASLGMTGPEGAFEAKGGAFDHLGGPFTLKSLQETVIVPNVMVKFWPVENNAQAGVWAAIELRKRMKLADIAEIDIAGSASAAHEIGSAPERWDPKTRETADHSLPYIVARTLVDGEISLASFEPEAYLDPDLRPVMAKIRVHLDKEIDRQFPAKVILRLVVTDTKGTRHPIEIVDPRGHPKNPMTDAELSEKFRRTAEPLLGAAQTTEALELLWSIEREKTLDRFYRLLTPAGAA